MKRYQGQRYSLMRRRQPGEGVRGDWYPWKQIDAKSDDEAMDLAKQRIREAGEIEGLSDDFVLVRMVADFAAGSVGPTGIYE